uniref:Immunoglobulin V-set domain-containing protein n=1 Tax=Accipiter nisus TaxID=211598 RepID=A0A8B9RUC6_9AVES
MGTRRHPFQSSSVSLPLAQVQQEASAETTEGTGISINCSHPNIRISDYIHWYRQLPGRGPAFITFVHKGSTELSDPPGRLSVAADRRSSALWLYCIRRVHKRIRYITVLKVVVNGLHLITLVCV